MGDGLAAAIGAGDEIGRSGVGRRGVGIGLGRAADEAGPLGPTAGLAKHGACPQLLASMWATIHRGCDRQIVRFSHLSQCLPSRPQKSLFV